MTANLHELINKRGYGSAAKIIGPPDDGPGTFTVNLLYTIEVEAINMQEAVAEAEMFINKETPVFTQVFRIAE